MKILVFLFLFLYFTFSVVSQNTMYRSVLNEHYDKGFVLGGSSGQYISLSKTDINGHMLWRKYFGSNSGSVLLYAIYTTPDGGFIVAGKTNRFSELMQCFEPLYMKVSVCGELEWCKVIRTPNHANCAGVDVAVTPSGVVKGLASFPYYPDASRTLFTTISADGLDVRVDTMRNAGEQAFSAAIGLKIMTFSDSSVTFCMQSMHNSWDVWAKVDSVAQFVWMQDVGAGFYFDSQYDGSSRIYASANLFGDNNISMGVMDDSGQEPGIWAIWEANTGTPGMICPLNAEVILSVFRQNNTSTGTSTGITVIDSSGNRLHDHFIQPGSSNSHQLIKTMNGEVVYLHSANTVSSDLGIVKYEYTGAPDYFVLKGFDTTQYIYDSFCPTTIVTDTVDITAELIVSNKEAFVAQPASSSLTIWPVPATQEINIRFQAIFKQGDCIKIYNSSGNLLETLDVEAGINTQKMEVSEYKTGIYFVCLLRDSEILATGKFIR